MNEVIDHSNIHKYVASLLDRVNKLENQLVEVNGELLKIKSYAGMEIPPETSHAPDASDGLQETPK